MHELLTEQYARDPMPILSRLRDQAPICWHDDLGFWTLARHRDVDWANKNHVQLSNVGSTTRHAQPGTFEYEVHSRRLSSRDRPSHLVLRRLLGKAFPPATVAALQPAVRAAADALLDNMAEHGGGNGVERNEANSQLDWVEGFAYPLPVVAVNAVLGVPNESLHEVGRYSGTTERELADYFKLLVAQRVQEPDDSVTSALIAAAVEGNEWVSLDEVHFFLAAFWTAGSLTTTNLLTNIVAVMEREPDVRRRLAADRGVIPSFVEEVLRFEPPVLGIYKTALEDIEIDGQLIRKGDSVHVLLGAANRDPDAFADPDVFDLRRSPNHHVSFSGGIHFCLGAPLARLEGRVAVEALLDHPARFEVHPDRGIHGGLSSPLNGYLTLPVTVHRQSAAR